MLYHLREGNAAASAMRGRQDAPASTQARTCLSNHQAATRRGLTALPSGC